MQSWAGDALGWLFQYLHFPHAEARGGERGAPGCGYEPGKKRFLAVRPSLTARPLVAAHLYGLYPTMGPVSRLVRGGTQGRG